MNSSNDVNIGRDIMSSQEIHSFGIEAVAKSLREEGYEDVKICTNQQTGPQITALIDGQKINVMVRTAMFPERGQLENTESVKQTAMDAETAGELCLFASVGLFNSEAENEAEASLAIRGGTFYVSYTGLQQFSLE